MMLNGGEEALALSSQDRVALQHELERLDARLARLDQETDDELMAGCEVLLAHKHEQCTQAHARFARCKATATALYEYESQQARDRYVARCRQLQQDMSDEMMREIRRLQQTRDGVSVMDRRRLKRQSGGGHSITATTVATSNGSTTTGSSNFGGNGSVASTVVSAANTGTGGSGAFPSSGLGGTGLTGAPQSNGSKMGRRSLMHTSLSCENANSSEDRASLAQLAEKRRLEVLLSATPVFPPLDKTVTREDGDADVEAIRQSMQQARATLRSGARTAVSTGGGPVAMVRAPSWLPEARAVTETESKKEMEVEPLTGLPIAATGESRTPSPVLNTFKRRRLLYNPSLLQDGQSVVVYRSSSHGERELVASGVIASATASQVFILTGSGAFTTVAVSDWKSGHISVHAVDPATTTPSPESF